VRAREHDVGHAQLGLELVADVAGVVRLADDRRRERVAADARVGGVGVGVAAALAQRQARVAVGGVLAHEPAGGAAGPAAQHMAELDLGD
jgi:hypothetical protein